MATESAQMSYEERIKLLELAEAAEDAGDEEKAERYLRQIPLDPGLAWSLAESLGKKEFLEGGFNLVDVEAKYGPGWLDQFAD